MATSSYKKPPTLGDGENYEQWLKEIKIWQMFTDLPKAKQGAALFLTLSGKARDIARDIDVDSLASDDGIKIIIEKLNPLYLKDKVQNAYIQYEPFEAYKRPKELNMKDYINEFERLHNKIKEYVWLYLMVYWPISC